MKYLGPSSPVQGWINENATSFSIDLYDNAINLKELNLAYSEVLADKNLPLSHLLDRIEMMRGLLETFDPSSVAGQRVNQLPLFQSAKQPINHYLELATKWANTAATTGERKLDQNVVEAGREASLALRKVTIEAIDKELQSRDDMINAIMSSRKLANNTFNIAVLLYIFGAIALGSVYWASGAWVAAERARFERLEYLLATVGHELRSPLQAIVSSANLLRRTIAYGENVNYVNIIRDSSGQLARLVNDLVGLARNEELSLLPATVHLTEWVEKISSRFHVEAERKGLKFFVDVPSNLPDITFDETRLTQCVGNLLTNALRYTIDGTVKLIINVTNQSVDEGLLQIDVQDTGRGIAAKDRDRIFQPFVRVSMDTKGMGLGLAIVSNIVRAVHGQISLESEVGKGSTFTIVLPVKYVHSSISNLQHQEQSPSVIVNQSSTVGGRILVVDDDQSIATVLSAVVEEMGYPASQAQNGEEALKMALEAPYFAIITDIQMPIVDGFELAQECRKKLHPCPALIAMTAYTLELRKDPRAYLFDKTLSKPVDDEILLNVLENLSQSLQAK